MELRIISTEIIKPSSPTPHHLKTYNLSMMDQLSRYGYFPLIFFYSEVENNTVKITDHLKKSLSEILVHYYPLAGRVKDDFSIDCDDNGAPFVEAHIASEMSEVLKNPEINVLEQLVPVNLNQKFNLAIQVNRFDCGGGAICAYFGHVVADATTAASFVNNWAQVASGFNDIRYATFDCPSIFPPRHLTTSWSRSFVEKKSPTENTTKRFRFDGSKIAILREKMSNTGSSSYYPTRFEAVSAVIWSALIAMDTESNESAPSATIPVNLRKRMNPPLPPHCFGNILLMIATKVMDHEATDDYNSLARNIHESVKMVNGDYLSKVKEDDSLIKVLEGTGKVDKMFCFSSWGRLPFYEADFGWGKPTWVTTANRGKGFGIFLDTCDGKGIEVWVALSKNNMAKFQKNDGILTYAAFDPAI